MDKKAKNSDAKSPHANHRQRMYERLKQSGAEGFYDHELLEMLLYFSIPRRNTNDIAHNLISSLNGIGGIFDADMAALKSVDGVGDKSAIQLSIIGELLRRKNTADSGRVISRINSFGDAKVYCNQLFENKKYECFYAICLDIKGKVVSDGFIAEGGIDHVSVCARKVVETAIRHSAYSVVLAHNHPGGNNAPSEDDNIVTLQLKNALGAIGVRLNDHIIIGENGCYSYALHKNILCDEKDMGKNHLAQNTGYEYKGIE